VATLTRPAGAMDGSIPGQKSSTGSLLSLSGNAQVFVAAVAEDLVPIDSPAFTGTPTAPTPGTIDNSTKLATTAYVTTKVANATSGFQPLDADLTALAALTGTNTIYYRSAADTWSAVGFSGLTFASGTLTVTVTGAPLASPVFTGDPRAPTPPVTDNDTSIATTAFVKSCITPGMQFGQCRLSFVSATQIRLDPYDGNKLFINGVYETIPAAGITASNSGLTAGLVYNVYAFMSGGVMTLELSVTARALNPTYGNQIKSGAPTHSLVGKVKTRDGTNEFMFQNDICYVINWFNRRQIALTNTLATNFTTSSVTYVTMGIYIQFITWGEDTVGCGVQTSISSSAAGTAYIALVPDDSIPSITTQASTYSYSSTNVEQMCCVGTFTFAEGYHFVNPYASVVGGAVLYLSDRQTKTWAVIRG
jgi:hypothetical protein